MGKKETEKEMEWDTIIIPREDGTEALCGIMGEFDVKGEHFIALMEIDEKGQPLSEQPYFYYCEEDGDDIILDDITQDAVYDEVEERFDELMDEAAFEEM